MGDSWKISMRVSFIGVLIALFSWLVVMFFSGVGSRAAVPISFLTIPIPSDAFVMNLMRSFWLDCIGIFGFIFCTVYVFLDGGNEGGLSSLFSRKMTVQLITAGIILGAIFYSLFHDVGLFILLVTVFFTLCIERNGTGEGGDALLDGIFTGGVGYCVGTSIVYGFAIGFLLMIGALVASLLGLIIHLIFFEILPEKWSVFSENARHGFQYKKKAFLRWIADK